ncbi:calpastatin [Pontibacter sp. HJ8]
MTTENNLQRFIDAQAGSFQQALTEIRSGRKQSHWMWFIFPQLQGLGYSETARYYAIRDLEEAALYLQHPVLGQRLIEISKALLHLEGKTANQILGSPDDLKLKSSMTLFGSLENADPVFQAVLDKYFKGSKDDKTLQLLSKQG